MYWPSQGKSSYCDNTVETLDISEYTDYTIRTFRITEVGDFLYWPSQGKNPYGDNTVETLDISEYTDYTIRTICSAVCNMSGYRCVSGCRSRGREFDHGLVPYFCGD